MNKRTNGPTNRQTAIPNTAYPSLWERVWYYHHNNQGVAFMITFLLFIIYMYIKTEECQDVILPEQEFHLLLILHKWNMRQNNTRQFSGKSVWIKMACFVPCNTILWQFLNEQKCHPNYQKISFQLFLDLLSVFEGSTHNSDRQLKLQPSYNIFDCIGIKIYTFVIVFTCSFYHFNAPMVTNEFYFFAASNFANKAITKVVTRQFSDQKIVWIWRNYLVNISILTDRF